MLIAFAGLPSSGKSSTAKALALCLNAPVFVEPEEEKWSNLVHDRETTGKFTALTWFRSVRIPNLFEANKIRNEGGTAVVDSYYDKIVSLYMRENCFSWLIPIDDPYFDVAYQMAIADLKNLPNADILIFLKLNRETWLRFMENRGREFDRSAELKHYFEMQDYMERACKIAADEHGMKLMVIVQIWSSPEETADLIYKKLKLPRKIA